MIDIRDFGQQVAQGVEDVFRLYVGQGRRFSYGTLADATTIPVSTLKSYANGAAMPVHALLRLIAVLPAEAGNQLMRPSGFKLVPIEADEDDWEGIGAEASMLTFEIFDAKKDGHVDHRERERLKSRCRTLIAKAEGAL
jgi:uncharacterized membrane protein YebE (DUF533 family)